MKRAAVALAIMLGIVFAGAALADLLLSPQVRQGGSWFWLAYSYFLWKGLWLLLLLAVPFCIVANKLRWTHWIYVLAGLFLGLVEPLAQLVKYRAAPWWFELMSASGVVTQTIFEATGWTLAAFVFWRFAVRSARVPNPSFQPTASPPLN